MSESKNLVVYFSLSGQTETSAKMIAQSCGADIEEINLEKGPFRKGNPFSMIKAFFHTMTRSAPAVVFSVDPEKYENIFIGTPVWGSTFASPLRGFFKNFQLKGKKIALFCVYNGSDGNVIENMKEALPGNLFTGAIGFSKPKQHPKKQIEAKVQEWTNKVLAKGTAAKK